MGRLVVFRFCIPQLPIAYNHDLSDDFPCWENLPVTSLVIAAVVEAKVGWTQKLLEGSKDEHKLYNSFYDMNQTTSSASEMVGLFNAFWLLEAVWGIIGFVTSVSFRTSWGSAHSPNCLCGLTTYSLRLFSASIKRFGLNALESSINRQ